MRTETRANFEKLSSERGKQSLNAIGDAQPRLDVEGESR